MEYKSDKNKDIALSNLKIGKNIISKRNKEIKSRYNLKPRKCHFCGKNIPYKKRRNLFCNRSCSKSYNNKNRDIKYFSEDLTGVFFENWKVIKKEEHTKNGKIRYLCQCTCGAEKIVYGTSLKSGKSKSCGCLRKRLASNYRRNIKDLTGMVFGNLFVLKRVDSINGQSVFLCKCTCGSFKKIRGRSLLNSKTISCGCSSESKLANELKKYFRKEYYSKSEYKIFKNPKTNQWLPYDIYIPYGDNPDLNGFYIEIHGEQHYKLSNWHKRQAKRNNTTPEEEFEYQKYKDKIKKKFAKKNGVYVEINIKKEKEFFNAVKKIESFLGVQNGKN